MKKISLIILVMTVVVAAYSYAGYAINIFGTTDVDVKIDLNLRPGIVMEPRKTVLGFTYKNGEESNFGLMIGLDRSSALAFNLDNFHDEDNMVASFTGLWVSPNAFFLFRPYMGGGVSYKFSTHKLYPSITFGTEWLFFFSEHQYILHYNGVEGIHRSGLRYKF